MNRTTARLASTLLAALALTAACSGDSNDGEGGTSGTGGGGGTTSNNAGAGKAGAGTAGSSTAGTSSSGSSSGGNNNGGANNNGGFTFAGMGGFNPDDYMCDPVPAQGSTCAEDAQPCLNGMDVCFCQMGEWSCGDPLGEGGGGPTIGEIECPATQPMTGTACGDVVGLCPYGGQDMGCVCYMGMWACTP